MTMMTLRKTTISIHSQSGMTMVELLVALAIGSFLMIGAVQVYNQSRQAYVINDSIARVQETAQFAMETVEADLRMASNWGQNSRAASVVGHAEIADTNPLSLPVPVTCGADWALDLTNPLVGTNNAYTLPCAAQGGAQANSDVITARRATVAASPLEVGRIQIQTSRVQGQLFADGVVPAGFNVNPALPPVSETHNLLVNSYYVAASSDLIPGVPTLRRKTLMGGAGGPRIVDQEIAPGVENIQLQLGVDVDEDNTVDRYVNPGDPIFIPGDAAFIPGARVMTARVWIVVRGISREIGIQDNVNYQPGDIGLGVYADDYRRMQVSKTVLLRNART
jgi:type IV pilus assembly protein PilW